MVLPAAAAAVHAAGAGATALGLGMGKTDLDLTRDLFNRQMTQSKRLWTADYAENSVRHGEACTQAAQQHAEAVALATATYIQAEKLAAQSIQLTAQQDARGYELAWRAEVRESLRDELVNQNNRFNIIMLCDTVCLSCVFSLIAEGSPPSGTSAVLMNCYVGSLGFATTLFSISMWCSVIVVRRLHEHTAATLEQKIFTQSEDLRKIWQEQVRQNLPTGPYEMHLVNRAYEQWLHRYVNGLGHLAISLVSLGVVAMFVTAGLLMQIRYQMDHNAQTAVLIFWSTVVVTSTAVLFMKYNEDKMEKQKIGVYDVSWQDKATIETGPFAKISKAAENLLRTVTALGTGPLGNCLETLSRREKEEFETCPNTRALQHRAARMRAIAKQRTQTRQEVLQLLTTAAEELDSLPEEFLTKLNKLLHDVDDADNQTAHCLALSSNNNNNNNNNSERRRSNHSPVASSDTTLFGLGGSQRLLPMDRPISPPVDAQRLPVPLGALRKKLGEITLTTLIRIQNRSDEPLRLVSGVRLKEGRYIKSLTLPGTHSSNQQTYHLYPVSEITPHTEVVMVARSGGGLGMGWVPIFGIAGEIVYTNKNQSWTFRINFTNELVRGHRRCQVEACPTEKTPEKSSNDLSLSLQTSNTTSSADEYNTGIKDDDQQWRISREVLDRKANNEVVICIDMQRGKRHGRIPLSDGEMNSTTLKAGFLLKNRQHGLQLQWQQRWFVLTPTELMYAHDRYGKKQTVIPVQDIISARPGSEDLMHKYILEIWFSGRDPLRLAASSELERDDWIQSLSRVLIGGTATDAAKAAYFEYEQHDSIECIQSERGITEVVLPV